jgi:UDPglucose--hexose-1-phosphate uridylyltransferase
MNRIQKNVHFKADTAYGELDITINLSKPEKDPEQIRREREVKRVVDYPKCVLCVENEGYVGRTGYPARANHRVITVPMLGENWYLQYSPYVYYNEHSILLSEAHRDMKIDKKAFERLLLFAEKYPHYFIGSNADLPIVGGSILSHDHYQAGRYEFAMTKAENAFNFAMEGFSDVTASVLKWPLSVIRLKSDHQRNLIEAADHILIKWKNYSDSSAHIKAFTGETPHNTITPIARRRGTIYELDLVLRNNRTTEEHPLGIFHPHADVQHIKKENIGLIEVMGLAVLPARLKDELAVIKKELLGQDSQIESYHQPWVKQLKEKHGTVTDAKEADRILENELGNKFARVLEDAGVFKDHDAFERFIHTLNS